MNDQYLLTLESPNDYVISAWQPERVGTQKTKVRYVELMDKNIFVEIHQNFSFSKQ